MPWIGGAMAHTPSFHTPSSRSSRPQRRVPSPHPSGGERGGGKAARRDTLRYASSVLPPAPPSYISRGGAVPPPGSVAALPASPRRHVAAAAAAAVGSCRRGWRRMQGPELQRPAAAHPAQWVLVAPGNPAGLRGGAGSATSAPLPAAEPGRRRPPARPVRCCGARPAPVLSHSPRHKGPPRGPSLPHRLLF